MVLILALLAGAGVGLYYLVKYLQKRDKEQFTNAASIDHAGMFTDQNYQLPAESKDTSFADVGHDTDVIEMYGREQGDGAVPKSTNHLTPWNVNVADPTSYHFLSNPVMVSRKPKNLVTDVTMAVRGDAPIRFFPNIPRVGRSIYGPDQINGYGLYQNSNGHALYNKYTGKEALNLPMHVVNEELIMDH